MEQLKLSKVNQTELKQLINKFLSFEKFVFIKFDKHNISTSQFTTDKSVAKNYKTETSNIFEFHKDVEDHSFKLSFYDGKKLLSALEYFKKDLITALIELDNEVSDDGSYNAKSITLIGNELKIKLTCADLSLGFMEMTDVQVTRAFISPKQNTSVVEFEMSTDTIDTIKSLFTLDNTNNSFKIYTEESMIKVSGTNFENVISKKYAERNGNSIQLTIDKEKLKYLDKDNYIVNLCADRIIFESTTDATKVTLAARKED